MRYQKEAVSALGTPQVDRSTWLRELIPLVDDRSRAAVGAGDVPSTCATVRAWAERHRTLG